MSQYDDLSSSTAFQVEHNGSSSRLDRGKARGSRMVSRKTLIVVAITVVSVAIAFTVGYLVRRAVHNPSCSSETRSVSPMTGREKVWDAVVKRIDASRIDANMK